MEGRGLLALSMVFSALGLVALIVGIIPAMVFVTLLWVSAHRQLFGEPATA